MALLGTLKGFGVTEIFQLIAQQMKTGTLILTSPTPRSPLPLTTALLRESNQTGGR